MSPAPDDVTATDNVTTTGNGLLPSIPDPPTENQIQCITERAKPRFLEILDACGDLSRFSNINSEAVSYNDRSVEPLYLCSLITDTVCLWQLRLSGYC